MARFLLVCLGGAVGSGARFALSSWIGAAAGAAFPWGTLAVNLAGSFLLGVVMQLGVAYEVLSPSLRLALGTGVMGGFTTYSTFNYETLVLFQDRAWLLGVANAAAHFVGCLLAGWLGFVVARRIALA